MRKTVSIILSIVLILTSLSVSFARRGDSSNLEGQSALAYGEVISDITSKVKNMSSDGTYTLNFNSKTPFGISYSQLIDFDGDNTFELIVFYFLNGAYNCEVWTLDGENALQIANFSSNLDLSASNSESVYLADRDDGAELIIYKYGNGNTSNETIDIFTVSSGAWKNSKTYKAQVVDDSENGFAMQYNVSENGTENTVDKNEYDALKGLYVNDAIDELVRVDVFNKEIYVNKLKSDVNHTDELNKIAAQINSFVNSLQNKAMDDYSYSDVISSLSEGEKNSLVKLLTYFTGWGFSGNIDLTKPYNDIIEFVAYKTAEAGLSTVSSSSVRENYVMVDAMIVDSEFEKKFGFYPNEVYYNNNYVNKGFCESGYYHLPSISNDYKKSSVQPDNMYKISDEIYLIPFSVYTWDIQSPIYSNVDVNLYNGVWSTEQKNSAKQEKHGYAVVKSAVSTENPYTVLEYKTGGLYPDEEYLSRYDENKNESELSFNYNADFKNKDDFIDELDSVFSKSIESEVSFADKEKIRDFIEFSIESAASKSIRAKRNNVSLTVADINELDAVCEKMVSAFDEILSKYNISLNGDIKRKAKLFAGNVSDKSTVKISLDKKLLNSMNNTDALVVVLGNESFYAEFPKTELEKIFVSVDRLDIEISKKGSVYDVEFSSGEIIDKISGSVKIAFPCEYDLNTVFYNDYDENWGGQYNYLNESIEIYTSFSGEYEIVDGKKTISDTDEISADDKKLVEFLVSRDIISLDDKCFNPNGKMTRNELTRAVVKILYCLDKDSRADYSDVMSDDKFYDYIASSSEKGLINGFGDETFRGDGSVTREALISLSSRILCNEGRYNYNSFTADEPYYFDILTISGWDNQKNEVYLTSNLGIINQSGLLMPRTDVTRLEAAKILYKLYNSLYKIPEAKTLTNGSGISSVGIVIAIAALVLIIVFSAVAIIIKFRRKRSR